jgi:hypothetical protein
MGTERRRWGREGQKVQHTGNGQKGPFEGGRRGGEKYRKDRPYSLPLKAQKSISTGEKRLG